MCSGVGPAYRGDQLTENYGSLFAPHPLLHSVQGSTIHSPQPLLHP